MSKITNRQNLKLEAGNYCLEQVRVPHSGGHKEEGEGEHQVVSFVSSVDYWVKVGLHKVITVN